MIFKQKNKKVFWFRVLSLVFLSCFLMGNEVSAAWWNVGDQLVKGVNIILYGIYVLVNMIFGLSMWLLDFIISPDTYKDIFFSSVAREGINTAWSFVRDFFNLFFILIIVLVGISTILGVSKFKDKSIITRVAFSAMLINFSKPITLFIIDASQVFTVFFANALSENDYTALLGSLIKIESLSDVGKIPDDSAFTVIVIMSTIMVLVMAVMIFFLAISLVVRFIAFQVLIVLSPIAMFGFAMEGTKIGNLKDDWFKKMISWSFYAPILLFFMWLALVLVDGLQGAVYDKSGTLTSTMNTQNLDVDNTLSKFLVKVAKILIPYITAIYLLFYGYDKAKEVSNGMATKILGKGSDVLSKMGEKALWTAKQITLPGHREALKEGVKYGVENYDGPGSFMTKKLTKKGRDDIQAKRVAVAKDNIGGDEGSALRAYYRGKAQEKLKDWKDNPPSDKEVDKMFNSDKEEERLAAILYRSQNNQLGIDKNGKNLYSQAVEKLKKGGQTGLLEQVTRETKKENLGAVINHEQDEKVKEMIKNRDPLFEGLVPGTDEYDEAVKLARVNEDVFKKYLGGNLNEIFKKQNRHLYEQEGVFDYLYNKHAGKKQDTRRKFAENIKNTEIEDYILSHGRRGEVLLGKIDHL